MAFNDYSNTDAISWADDNAVASQRDTVIDPTDPSEAFSSPAVVSDEREHEYIDLAYLSEAYNIPGFGENYMPLNVPNPINGSLESAGGGGSVRPETPGLLWPRGS